MEEPAKVKSRRGIMKMVLTKSITKFQQCEQEMKYIQYKKLLAQYEELRLCHLNYLVIISKDDEDPSEEDQNYLDSLETKLDEAEVEMGKLKKEATISNKSFSKEKSVDLDVGQSGTIFKVSKIEMRKFDGDQLDYLQWKEDAQAHYLPYVNDSMRFLALKEIVGRSVQGRIIGCNTVLEIWAELDRIYGCKSKISAAILTEIDQFPAMTDIEVDKFIKFTERIHRARRELMKFQMDAELNNSHMVSVIERKLPPRVMSEWAEQVVMQSNLTPSKSTVTTSKFAKLLDFMRLKAAAKEYQMEEIRSKNDSPKHSHFTGSKGTNPHDFSGMKNNPMMQVGPVGHQTDFNRMTQMPSNSPCLVHFRGEARHVTTNCSIFLSKSPMERRQITIRARACFLCLQRGHRADQCSGEHQCFIPGCREKSRHHGLLHISSSLSQQGEGNQAQTQRATQPNPPRSNNPFHQAQAHHALTEPGHEQDLENVQQDGSNNPFHQRVNSHHAYTETDYDVNVQAMLPFQNVPVAHTTGKVNCLYDSGSNISIITDASAHCLQLQSLGKKTIELVKTGGEANIISSTIYKVPLLTIAGKTIEIRAYGMTTISSCIEEVNSTWLEQQFNLNPTSLHRPSGSVDLLVGTDVAGIHPIPINRHNNLILGKNPFGLVVWGTCSESMEQPTYINLMTNTTLNDFFQMESMGVECSPKCGSCRCGTCPLGGKKFTIKEELELDLIRSNLHFESNHWTATYPWIRDPYDLPNNYRCILAQLYSLENRLRRKPELMVQYDDQIQDMLNRNVAKIATAEELANYKGPVYYLSHHEVMKESSSSTPCRIVFNPAQNYQGHILNDYWALGANLVQSLFDILMRFREYNVAIVGDISKMYHSVHTTELEWHTHRFLWRNLKDRKPDIYLFLRNSFGDKPAGTIAITAIQCTVEKFGHDHPRGSDTLMNAIFVDDIVDSQPDDDTAIQVIRDTEALLAKGGFSVKGWTLSRTPTLDTDIRILDTDRVLGLKYDHQQDIFKFVMTLNFQRGKNRKVSQFNLSMQDIPDMVPTELTKRMLVSQVNGIYDPHGLVSPFIVRAKCQLRKLWMYESESDGSKLGWDDPIPESHRQIWIEWFLDAFRLENLVFPRRISPHPLPSKDPMLVMFSDASQEALAATGYLRYETNDGHYESYFVASKTRVAPLNVKTIVRYEMQAAVMGKRLASSITQALRINISETIFIIDSEIVRAMINKTSYGFNTFFAVRIGEIIESTKPDQWYWIEGGLNIADWATRGRKPEELASDGIWQKGPLFLCTRRSEWPIRQSCSITNLPEMKSHYAGISFLTSKAPEIASVMDIGRHSSLHKLLRVTARVFAAFKFESPTGERKPSFRHCRREPTLTDHNFARNTWIIAAQNHKSDTTPSIHERMRSGQFDKLVPYTDRNGIIRAQGRIFTQDPNVAPVILPQNHPLSRLIVQEIHNWNHDGISTVVSKVRDRYWIIGAHRVAKTTRHQCTICNRHYGELQRQIMANLPPERTRPALPFQFVSLDLFGPFQLRIPGKSTRGRTFMDEKKAYGVIYTDLSSRAVYVDLARGYSLDAFLLVHRRFLAIRGSPDTLYSDNGPQLVAADKLLHKETLDKWDEDELIKHGVRLGTTWKFCSPDSPWQNGVSESLIRGVKRSLTLIVGDHPKLTVEELQTVLFEVANILNERPIGRHPTSPDECQYLRPNDLLLGRSTSRIRSGPWEDPSGDLTQRFLMVQSVLDDWYKRWLRDYFPTLVPRSKWHTQSRDVRIGDLVIVQDDRTVRSQWTLGQVCTIHPSADGKVRNVDVRYKIFPPNEANNTYKGVKDAIIKRSVQRLVVISPIQED